MGDAGDFISDSVPDTAFSSKEISLSSGNFSMSKVLLSTGVGDFPNKLSYSISKLFQKDNVPGSLFRAIGSVSNQSMSRTLSSDLSIAMGSRSAIEASRSAVAIMVATDILVSDFDFEGQMLATSLAGNIYGAGFNNLLTSRLGANINFYAASTPLGRSLGPGSHTKYEGDEIAVSYTHLTLPTKA